MENYLAKTHKPKIFFTLPNFRINGEPHNSKPHKRRTKCISSSKVKQFIKYFSIEIPKLALHKYVYKKFDFSIKTFTK